MPIRRHVFRPRYLEEMLKTARARLARNVWARLPLAAADAVSFEPSRLVRGAAVQPDLFLLHPIHDPALGTRPRPCLGPCRPRRLAMIVDFGQCEALPRLLRAPGGGSPNTSPRAPPSTALAEIALRTGPIGVRAALWRLCLVWCAHATRRGRPTTGTRWSRNSSAVRRQVKSRA